MCRLAALLVLVALPWPLSGCAGKRTADRPAPVTSGVERLEMSTRELRVRVRALTRPLLGLIEEGSDRVLAEVEDPGVRRATLVWKIESTTTLMNALLRNDPVLALADSMGYVMQLEDFVARPEFREEFGPLVPEITVTLGRMHRLLFDFAAGVQEDLSGEEFETTMREWAAEHPIEGSIYRRPTIDSAVAGLLAAVKPRGVFAVIEGLDETTAEIMTRLDLYTTYLPRLSRWEAEIGIIDTLGGADLGTVATEFGRLTGAVDRIAGVAEHAPSLVEQERQAAFDAVRDERLAATADLRAERRAVLEAVSAERIAILAEVEAIAVRLSERAGQPLHDAVRTETDRLVDSVEEMRGRLIEDAGVVLGEVIDHAFVRALQLLLIAAVLFAIGVVLHERFLRLRRSAA